MTLEFSKMNGAGNDFVLVDNRSGAVQLAPEQVVNLCHRQRGIGADGLLLVVANPTGRADWSWQFYNSDGSLAEMCGNGARCFARFVQRLTGAAGDLTFETGAGVIRASFQGEHVTVNLTTPHSLRLQEPIEVDGRPLTVHSLNTGVPHAVVFVPEADQAMVQQQGRAIRRHAHFSPRGTNVNFAQILGPGHIRVRTYERGVEGETLACGTGVTASALITARLQGFPSPVKVQVQGGDTLEVAFAATPDGFGEVRLTGPADFVFEGRISL